MGPTDAFPPWTGLVVLAFSTLWLGVIGLVVIYSGHPRLAVLRRPRLRWAGKISYGLYLYHFLVIVISGDIYRQHRPPRPAALARGADDRGLLRDRGAVVEVY